MAFYVNVIFPTQHPLHCQECARACHSLAPSAGSLTSTSYNEDADLQADWSSCQVGLKPVKDEGKLVEGGIFQFARWHRRNTSEKVTSFTSLPPEGILKRCASTCREWMPAFLLTSKHIHSNGQGCVCVFFLCLGVSVCICSAIWHSQTASSIAQWERWHDH